MENFSQPENICGWGWKPLPSLLLLQIERKMEYEKVDFIYCVGSWFIGWLFT